MDERPWMIALERKFVALRTHGPFDQFAENPDDPNFAIGAARVLRIAETFAWTKDTVKAVWLASKTVPSNTSFEPAMLPSSAGWWWLDFGLDDPELEGLLYGPSGIDGLYNFICMVSTETASGILGKPLVGFAFQWSAGTTLDDIVTASKTKDANYLRNVVDLGRFVLAACAWLQQRVVSVSTGHVERHRRKQLAREHNAPIPSDVNVIQLRRSEPQPHQPTVNGESVDWSCRWIVGGHWRNQPYRDKRKLIYIMPYVKGPDDKPLKIPTATVYSVSR